MNLAGRQVHVYECNEYGELKEEPIYTGRFIKFVITDDLVKALILKLDGSIDLQSFRNIKFNDCYSYDWNS